MHTRMQGFDQPTAQLGLMSHSIKIHDLQKASKISCLALSKQIHHEQKHFLQYVFKIFELHKWWRVFGYLHHPVLFQCNRTNVETRSPPLRSFHLFQMHIFKCFSLNKGLYFEKGHSESDHSAGSKSFSAVFAQRNLT